MHWKRNKIYDNTEIIAVKFYEFFPEVSYG